MDFIQPRITDAKTFTVLLVVLCALLPARVNANVAYDANNPIFKGKVLVEEVKHPTGIPGLRATFVVHSTRDAIWKALTDYVDFTKIFDGIDKMKVQEQDNTGATIEFWADAIIFNIHSVMRRTYDKPGRELSWKRVSGDMKDIRGRWVIEDTDRKNIFVVKYESYVDVGFYIATAIARSVAMNKAESMAVRLRKWIEAHQ